MRAPKGNNPMHGEALDVEGQRQKVGITPETFIADTLEGLSGYGWRELGELWRDRGGRREDLAGVVRDPATPYRFRREDDSGRLYVEVSDGRTAKKAPGEVVTEYEVEWVGVEDGPAEHEFCELCGDQLVLTVSWPDVGGDGCLVKREDVRPGGGG